jgi:signal transduction histidine kinase
VVTRTLTQIEAVLSPSRSGGRLATRLEDAEQKARRVEQAAGGGPTAARLAAIRLAADVLVGGTAPGAWNAEEVDRVVEALVGTTGLRTPTARAALYDATVRGLRSGGSPPGPTIEAVLGALVAFAPLSEASLWLRRPSLECVAFAGEARTTRRVRAAAASVFDHDALPAAVSPGRVHAVPVLRCGRPLAALVVRARSVDRDTALTFAEDTTGALGSELAFQISLERDADLEQVLVQASERRLTRIGFDLHDGPLQELAALAADIRLLRAQAGGLELGDGPPGLLGGRLDDFDARLVQLDRDLRELAHSLESPGMIARPLAEQLRGHAAALERQTGIDVSVEVEGDLDALSPSQRLAVARMVQEALTNVREHSGARSVSVRVEAGPTHTEAIVVDDGRGFQVERTLVRAAQRGRLGLVGMAERVRLLGGGLDVESRPGGPTTVAATIPRWEPLGARRAARLRVA